MRTLEYLGLTIDNKLKWNDHISNLTKAIQIFFMFLMILDFWLTQTLNVKTYTKLVSRSIIHHHHIWNLHLGSSIYYDSHRYRLKITLNRLIKFLLIKPMSYSNNLAYLELNVTSIDNLYISNIP